VIATPDSHGRFRRCNRFTTGTELVGMVGCQWRSSEKLHNHGLGCSSLRILATKRTRFRSRMESSGCASDHGREFLTAYTTVRRRHAPGLATHDRTQTRRTCFDVPCVRDKQPVRHSLTEKSRVETKQTGTTSTERDTTSTKVQVQVNNTYFLNR
jgi:hypothetical protein